MNIGCKSRDAGNAEAHLFVSINDVSHNARTAEGPQSGARQRSQSVKTAKDLLSASTTE